MSMSVDQAFERFPELGRQKLMEYTGISEHEARIQCRFHKGKKDVNEQDIKLGVAIGDIHYPYQNSTVDICKQFIGDNDVDYFLLAGDQLDLDLISSFNRRKPLLKERKRLQKTYDGFQRDILDPFNSVLRSDTKRFWLVGNHEVRANRLVEEQPVLEGMVEPENCLNLSGYEFIPENGVVTIGEMSFIHGTYYNKYHAKKNIETYGRHIFSWHVHTNQVYTMHSPIDTLPRQGVSVGCACNLNPEYMHNKPSAFVNQFLIFYLFPNGQFTYYTPTIINNRVIINGKLYEG